MLAVPTRLPGDAGPVGTTEHLAGDERAETPVAPAGPPRRHLHVPAAIGVTLEGARCLRQAGPGCGRSGIMWARRRGGARMGQEVRGVVAKAKGAPVTLETIVVPDPGPGRGGRRRPGVRRLPHRPALPRGRHQRRLPVPPRATRPRASSSRSGPASPTWRRVTSSSSTGAPCAASAGRAGGAGPGTASPPTTPRRR